MLRRRLALLAAGALAVGAAGCGDRQDVDSGQGGSQGGNPAYEERPGPATQPAAEDPPLTLESPAETQPSVTQETGEVLEGE